jgi:DNA-binding LacI/PurR family transcriptional regulator
MPNKIRASLKDIANETGLSISTVSEALRHSPKVRPETRKLVEEAAARLHYKPNPLVTALMSQVREAKQPTDSLVLALIDAADRNQPQSVYPWNHRVIEGAQRRASILGCKTEVFSLKRGSMTEERINQIILARGIQGVLVLSMPDPLAELKLDFDQFSLATIAYSLRKPRLHRVCADHGRGMRFALKKVTDLGYCRVGLYSDRETELRVNHQMLASDCWYNQQIPEEFRIPPLVSDFYARSEFDEWFDRWKPDAIISPRDFVVTWLRERGVRVPEDVGFASLNLTEGGVPAAGWNQRPDLQGEAAVETIMDQLNRNERGIPENPKTILLEGEWQGGPTLVDKPLPSLGRLGKLFISV